MQVANPKRAQFQKKLHFIPSDFPHFLKSTIGKELAPSITALVPPFPILLKSLCKRLHKQHQFIELKKDVFKKSEQFVLHLHNICKGNKCMCRISESVTFVHVLN